MLVSVPNTNNKVSAVSITNSGRALTLGNIGNINPISGNVLAVDIGNGIILNNSISANAIGDSIILSGTTFTNNAGSSGLNSGLGNFLFGLAILPMITLEDLPITSNNTMQLMD